MYSPASQKLTVGSAVKAYVIKAIPKLSHAIMLLHLEKGNPAISLY
jgi:hypothetical protein